MPQKFGRYRLPLARLALLPDTGADLRRVSCGR